MSIVLTAITTIGLLFAPRATHATTSQSLQLVVRAPTTLFALDVAIDLNLVFLNAGSDTLVLLRPKPEQSLLEGDWDLRARVWEGASAPEWVLEPSIAHSTWRTLSRSDFVTLGPGDSLVYPVRFGHGLFDLPQSSACGWDEAHTIPIHADFSLVVHHVSVTDRDP